MPYLDWTQSSAQLTVTSHPLWKTQLELAIGANEIDQLREHLEAIYVNDERELRLELPNQWLMFWKSREDGNRLLLAHPQSNEWVATLALERDSGKEWVSSMKLIKNGQSLNLSQVAPLASLSNLELKLVCKN